MKKIYTVVIAVVMVVSFYFISPQPASAQVVPVTKKVVKKSYRTGKRIGRKSYRGGRWVTIRVYRGGRWVTKKVWRGGKRVIMGKPRRRP
jgi:hypothetical protein